MVKLAREAYSEKLATEMRPLLERHNEETPQLGIPIDPDLKVYQFMDLSGSLRIYTARVGNEECSVLGGYQIFYVARHPHRKESLEATQDILYLAPEYRKGFTGIKFIRWCDEQLRKEGVRVIHHPIDARNDFGIVFRRMGYELTDLVYAKKMEAA